MQTIQDLPKSRALISGKNEPLDSEEHIRMLQKEAIDQLSKETGRDAEEIGSLYRRVFHELKETAQVHDYLFILTYKHVKHMLNRRMLTKQST